MIASEGTATLPRRVAQALAGYYSNCPSQAPMEEVEAIVLSSGIPDASMEFVGRPAHYFLGVDFGPTHKDWSLRSVNVSGDWRAAGLAVSATSREVIDFTATCPSSPGLHHLEIESQGGRWVVYLLTSRPE